MNRHAGFYIRSYGPADLPAARRLLNVLQEAECAMESNRAHWPDGAEAYTDWMLNEVAANDGAIFLADSESGETIGLVSCWRAEDTTEIAVRPEARVHLYVSDLVVLPDWRGRGVAGALLAEAEAHGRRLGLAQLTIGVLSANEAARRAYQKAGFEDYEMLLRKRL